MILAHAGGTGWDEILVLLVPFVVTIAVVWWGHRAGR